GHSLLFQQALLCLPTSEPPLSLPASSPPPSPPPPPLPIPPPAPSAHVRGLSIFDDESVVASLCGEPPGCP
ncbi:hypothetical protein TeGR_g15301, partial [Tetraparma gracilis]